LTGLDGRCVVVPIGKFNDPVFVPALIIPVDAVSTKLLADDCNNGVVTEVVPIKLGALIAPVDGL
jgi:hypothetical protein